MWNLVFNLLYYIKEIKNKGEKMVEEGREEERISCGTGFHIVDCKEKKIWKSTMGYLYIMSVSETKSKMIFILKFIKILLN